MPMFRQYPQAASILPTDAFLIDRLGVGTMYVEGLSLGNIVVFPTFANQAAYLAANPNPLPGACYYDQSLGYPVVLLGDATWHGLLLS